MRYLLNKYVIYFLCYESFPCLGTIIAVPDKSPPLNSEFHLFSCCLMMILKATQLLSHKPCSTKARC